MEDGHLEDYVANLSGGNLADLLDTLDGRATDISDTGGSIP